ncbi:MAG TPA: SLC13 family permease, partial [Tepidisphaeraceae bacterium]|nr:SLC13 family permease [Tepidisphaeraceae bacterium]
MRKAITFASLLISTCALLLFCGWFEPRQIASIAIFTTFIYGTLIFAEFRLAFAFGGIATLMTSGLLTVPRFTQAASLDVIVFLIGTFIVIGYLEENQFFEGIVASLTRLIGPRPQLLLAGMMILASLFSALIGEVTAILFMAGAMLNLTSRYRLDATPFVIMLVFACNIGSAMSSVGNPIGVMIALKTGLSFVDFLKWAAPISLVVDGVVYAICRWWYADAFAQFGAAMETQFSSTQINLSQNKSSRKCWAILIGLIAMLSTHGLLEEKLHLGEGTMMVAAALTMGSVVLLLSQRNARGLVERRVDWWTLSFFMMLFASVGTLEDTMVTQVIAHKVRGGFSRPGALIQVIGWSTGWLSAFLDNVLAVATFMPVVHDIRKEAGVPFSSS